MAKKRIAELMNLPKKTTEEKRREVIRKSVKAMWANLSHEDRLKRTSPARKASVGVEKQWKNRYWSKADYERSLAERTTPCKPA
jgi:hypothetical protein